MDTGWKVTSLTPGQVRTSTGQYGPGWTVMYQTADGTTGSVTIAKQDYSKDALAALISGEVAQLAEMKSLTGG